ncbi:Hsp20/alpha crystallin family protein [Endozoicomonas sp. SM1973]|uniref:Hsp20/alpha crystallin family protein n=1 Tax=Spartinivicinus marinus TaxID=2994442 RepID=A0A853I6X9_9GAMM|nr:Hsp20/alpha crystallin family protein [Spartinivicinus marinus]MCX4027688.1 Hsp20/alpha crystallin family protein [Spartinivicinus marinus]NYZ69063.1 Hsp20/alpha crystallin family protein [Spartinivicinus marinus]
MNVKNLIPWNWLKKEEERDNKQLSANSPRDPMANPLIQFHRDVDRLFDSMFKGVGLPNFSEEWSKLPNNMFKPNIDISAKDKEYLISVEVPGVDEKDIKLEMRDNSLIISGEKKHEKEDKEEHLYRVERSYGHFQRILAIPEDANVEEINASFKNGVLCISLPRKELPDSKTKQIEIKKAS